MSTPSVTPFLGEHSAAQAKPNGARAPLQDEFLDLALSLEASATDPGPVQTQDQSQDQGQQLGGTSGVSGLANSEMQDSQAAAQATPQEAPVAIWQEPASWALEDLSRATLIVRADVDSMGRFSLDAQQSALLRQEANAWLDAVRKTQEFAGKLLSPVVRDQMARRAVQELLEAAQASPTQVWAGCLPSGRPVVIATAEALGSLDHDAVVRRMHQQALQALRDAGLPFDGRALQAYEQGQVLEAA